MIFMKKKYYMFRMNIGLLNIFSLVLIALLCFVYYLIYGNQSLEILHDNIKLVLLLYGPYLLLHEILHSIAYVLNGANFKKITYGIHLEKGILCCLCKQNISKINILISLLCPFFFIGVVTLILGIVLNVPVLVILSLFNISGCMGDFMMFYYLFRLKDYEFSEYDDPIAFGLYTDKDFGKIKMVGIDYVEKKEKLERNDLRKIVISKESIIFFTLYYIFIILLYLL